MLQFENLWLQNLLRSCSTLTLLIPFLDIFQGCWVRNSGFLSLPGDLRRSRHFSQSRVSSRSKSLSCAEGIQKRARRTITVYGGLNRATVRYWAGFALRFALAGGNTVGIANTKDRTGGGGRNRTLNCRSPVGGGPQV